MRFCLISHPSPQTRPQNSQQINDCYKTSRQQVMKAIPTPLWKLYNWSFNLSNIWLLVCTQNFGICVIIFVEQTGHHIVNPNFGNYRFISPQPGGDTQNSLSSLSRPNPHQCSVHFHWRQDLSLQSYINSPQRRGWRRRGGTWRRWWLLLAFCLNHISSNILFLFFLERTKIC